MRALSTSELLDVWERALAQPPPERALTLLSASTGLGRTALAELPVGERDAQLLSLREETFGPHLTSLATCARCGERLEMTCAVADLRVAHDPEEPPPSSPLSVNICGYEVRFRLPNSHDLLALGRSTDEHSAQQQLLRRALLLATHDEGGESEPEQLPAEVVEAIAERMAEADPQADVQLALECPRCSHRWHETFDINSYLWIEINEWALRILAEVHTLARAYGWREQDVLAMSAWRRQFYMSLVSG
jgi:hypothetical protein